MKNYRTHKSSLFLIELILAISFFSLASAVCLQLFVKSHLLSKEPSQLNTGVNLVTSAAESFRQSCGDMDAVTAFMPELKVSNSEEFYTAYYDEDGLPCTKSDAAYILTLTPDYREDTALAVIKILLTEDNNSIYELPVQVHVPHTY